MRNSIYTFLAGTILLLTACGDGEDKKTTTENNITPTEISGCLDFAITEKYGSLDPIHVTDVASFHITSQIYEPLLRFDENDLTLEPLVAESWEVSDDNLVHTFRLKKGVHFHDHACFEGGKGREIKAGDVIYSFERMYAADDENYAYSLFKDKIAGGEAFKSNGGTISGITAPDEYTVQFTLTKPSSNFMSLLATISTAIVAKEAIEKNAIVGSGPFVYSKDADTENKITLSRNTNYHQKDGKGETLPYLDCVSFNYIKDGQEQLDLFMKGELDVITGLPSKSIKEIVETQIADFQEDPVKYVLGRYPQNATTYITLNTAVPPFDNQKVRQAVGMAIDKARIVDQILKGEAAAPGDHGIVPSAFKGYDYTSVVGLGFDVEKAKKLLSEAGYPNGNGLPILMLATGNGNTSVRVGLEIQKQLRANLNINVELTSTSLAERKEANAQSKNNMSIDGWLAEFPDPVSFLSLFYGANVPASAQEMSFPNESRFKNDAFDKLYEKALVTLDDKQRFELCLEADQIVANQAPCIPLWYHEDYHLIQSAVQGYSPNAMNLLYLASVKIETVKPEKTAEK
ncbi:MAG: ABC transporter substrate-binding protein [Flavobacteriales bacterium]|nr:ABC transporter substrate-binding protein [Flavobacteriales bacterium]